MKNLIYLFFGLMVAFPTLSWAYDLEDDSPTVMTEEERGTWEAGLKSKYNLTDEQIKQYRDSGASYPAITKAAALAKAASTTEKPVTIDDVMKMRTEQKMGWGKIARDFGVHPSTLGQSVAELKHEKKAEKIEKKSEKKAAKATAKAARKAERAEKKEKKNK